MLDDSRKVAPQPKRLQESGFVAEGTAVAATGFSAEGGSDCSALVACCQERLRQEQESSKMDAPFEAMS